MSEQPRGSSRLALPPTKTHTTTPTKMRQNGETSRFPLYRQRARQRTLSYGRNCRSQTKFHQEWKYCHRRNTGHTSKKQENVARALLTGLIFQKGVPLIFRNDEAAELVAGTAAVMHELIPWNSTSDDRVTQSPLKGRCRALHAAPDRLPDKVRRQPLQQHAGLPSRNHVCLPTSPRSIRPSIAHIFRGWTRTPSEPGRSRKHEPAPGCK
jgi:hypothetical protein